MNETESCNREMMKKKPTLIDERSRNLQLRNKKK